MIEGRNSVKKFLTTVGQIRSTVLHVNFRQVAREKS